MTPDVWMTAPPMREGSPSPGCIYGWAGCPILLGRRASDPIGQPSAEGAAPMDHTFCLGADLATELRECSRPTPSRDDGTPFWYRADHIQDHDVLTALRAKANVFSKMAGGAPSPSAAVQGSPGADDDGYARMISCAQTIVSESAARVPSQTSGLPPARPEDPFQAITGAQIVGQDPDSGKWTLELHVTTVVSGFIIAPSQSWLRLLRLWVIGEIHDQSDP
ncbi:unnamed protein product [Ostreobium quekettii]|uniref:Uncharacterized protein n=1 Tax=Ostreobium quekettii TaxID=121088 RepID=A0A8S1JBP6_9CHLO|nr:unnamed protein product [Ostreobium quekettii]